MTDIIDTGSEGGDETFEEIVKRKRRPPVIPPDEGLLAKGGEGYEDRPVPGVHAPFSHWICVDDQGAVSGHPEYVDVVKLGDMPICPHKDPSTGRICGNTIARPVIPD